VQIGRGLAPGQAHVAVGGLGHTCESVEEVQVALDVTLAEQSARDCVHGAAVPDTAFDDVTLETTDHHVPYRGDQREELLTTLIV